MAFIGGQVYEFTEFVREGLTLKTNVFGTTFYVLTGFHGTHVAVGVLCCSRCSRSRSRARSRRTAR